MYIDNAQLYLLVLVCQSMSLAVGVLLLVTRGVFHLYCGCLLLLDCMLYTTFLLTSLLDPLPLCAVAGVYFDPDVYSVNEGGSVTLMLRTNVTVHKRFSVLVNTRDDSTNSEYCINNTFIVKFSLSYMQVSHSLF